MLGGALSNQLRRLLVVWTAVACLAASSAFARTADINLTVVGDKEMSDELKKLTEDLDKDQPLTGDSLALLQGAQSRRADPAPGSAAGHPRPPSPGAAR